MSSSLKNTFPKNAIEYRAGRIPECLKRLPYNNTQRQQLLSLFDTSISFNPMTIKKMGWICIYATTDGQMDDSDEILLCKLLSNFKINILNATSHYELTQTNSHGILVAAIPEPTANDLGDLRNGFWCVGDWIELLRSKNLLWNSWQEGFYFSWPLKFALVQNTEGFGRTYIAGEPEIIDAFFSKSNSDLFESPSSYKWQKSA